MASASINVRDLRLNVKATSSNCWGWRGGRPLRRSRDLLPRYSLLHRSGKFPGAINLAFAVESPDLLP